MDAQGIITLLGGLGLGVGIGIITTYLVSVKALVGELRRMRFAGWQTVTEIKNQPKTIPLPRVRED